MRLREGGNYWTRECLKEIENRGKKGISNWERGRLRFMEERGVRQREIGEGRENRDEI